MKPTWIAEALVLAASAAQAQTPIGPFVGQHDERFDGLQAAFTPCLQYRIFDFSADVCTPGASGCHTTDQQFFACLISARSAPYFFSSIDGAVEFSFDHPVERFGGWFGTNQFFPDATVDFLDVNGQVLASAIASIPADCQWHWQGWDLGASSQVRKILVSGSPVFTGAFVDFDDLQVDYVGGGAPIVYCTAGTTSNGCQASIAASGNPNLAHTAPCLVTASAVEGQRSGLIFYGVSGPNAATWCATGTSLLCVKTPTQRTPPQTSGGTAGSCNGALALDWNAFQTSHPAALGQPWASTSSAFVQAWFRDPASCKTTNLSDALVLTYQP
jgi:hypothetical protein